jgi:hypothetical protein
MMRPTPVHAKLAPHYGGESILMIGGNEERESFAYSIKEDKYRKLPKLPIGHNITTNVCVNYKDQAVFTFLQDAKLLIKVAVMDLTNLDEEDESKAEMEWVMKMEQTEHLIDRFHLKCGVSMHDNRIVVVSRGRLPGMRE